MKSIKLGLVLVMGLALSIGFAQSNSKVAPGQKKGNEQAKMSRHHGKMTVKSTGKTQATLARHHGKMTAKHHWEKKHKGKMISKKTHHWTKKGGTVMARTNKVMGKEDHGKSAGHGNGH